MKWKFVNVWLYMCLFALLGQAQLPVKLNLKRTIELANDSSLSAFRYQNMYLSGYWEYRTYQANRLPSLTMNLMPAQYYRYITQRYDSNTDMDVYLPGQNNNHVDIGGVTGDKVILDQAGEETDYILTADGMIRHRDQETYLDLRDYLIYTEGGEYDSHEVYDDVDEFNDDRYFEMGDILKAYFEFSENVNDPDVYRMILMVD